MKLYDAFKPATVPPRATTTTVTFPTTIATTTTTLVDEEADVERTVDEDIGIDDARHRVGGPSCWL